MDFGDRERTASDWTSGPSRLFAAVVLLSLVCIGAWIARGSERRAEAWSEIGQATSIAAITAGSESDGEATPHVGSASTGAISGGILDLNIASAAQLELLPGIGPSGAARIIAYRDLIGGFRSIEELGGVKGIGTRTMERLRPLVRVGERAAVPNGHPAGP